MNSKTRLGVIILAFRTLRTLAIPAPRLVAVAAARLELSRKTGYQSAREIEKLLTGESPPSDDDHRRELARLRLKVQVLQFERDRRMRFSKRGSHLDHKAKSLCVRLFRDFRGELSESEIALTIEVPLSNLRRWDEEADADCDFPDKPENRGKHLHVSAEEAERVVEEYTSLEESMTLEAFTDYFNEEHPESPLDRKTITRLLQAHKEKEVETRSDHGERYHGDFDVYFPGAQFVVDATETKVIFSSQPNEAFTATQEVAIDVASTAILGEALDKEETAAGVTRVVFQARQECESVLAMLADNGPANRSERVERVAERETELGPIYAFPYRPETKGHVEGFFGQFSRIVGEIRIDDSSKQALATSIIAVIWRIFIHFHNFSARKRLGGLSPIEYLRRYNATPDEIDNARRGLERQQERSQRLRQAHPRLSDPDFRELVGGILERHRFDDVELDAAVKALLPFDESVIRNSDTAFFVASSRDGFVEDKRNFRYFMGIVRNKQRDIDKDRAQRKIEAEDAERRRACERQHERQKQQEARDLESRPERVILNYAKLLLIARLRWMKSTFLDGIRSGIDALRRLHLATSSRLDQLCDTIRGWNDFTEDLKDQMVDLLVEEFTTARSAAVEDSPDEPTDVNDNAVDDCDDFSEERKDEVIAMLNDVFRLDRRL